MKMRKCCICGKEYPATTEYFYKKYKNKDVLDCRCKKCKSVVKKAYYNKKDSSEKAREYAKKWTKENYTRKRKTDKTRYNKIKNTTRYKELKNKIEHKRKAIKKNLLCNFTIEQWEKCKEYFNNRCAYCGAEMPLTQDHFIALSKGGEYTSNNIIPSCQRCNSSKSNKDFFEWYPKSKYYSKEKEEKILKYLHYNKNKIQQLKLNI